MLLGKVIYIRLPLNIYYFANEYILRFGGLFHNKNILHST